MQQANKVAKNTIILYIQMAITVVLSLYTTRLVLAALGAEDYGVFNVVGGAIAMLTFLNAAMSAASQRFMSYASGEGQIKKQKKIFNISLSLHLLIALIIVVILEISSIFIFDDLLNIDPSRLSIAKKIYQFLIISTFFVIISVPYDAVINAHENMTLVAVLRILEVILKLVIALFISSSIISDKLYVYGFLMAILTVVLLIIRQVYCHKKYQEVEINFKKYSDKMLFKEMRDFAGWSFLGSFMSIITNYSQGIILNVFFGTRVNAAQGVSNQVSGQLGAFANVMLKALNPVIAKNEGAGNRQMMLKASVFGGKVSFFLLVLFYVPAIIEMPYIFRIWLEKIPEFTIVFCKLLLMRNLIEQLFLTLTSSIAAVGNIKKFRIWTSIFNIMPLFIVYILFSMDYPPYTLYVVFIFQALLNSAATLYFAKKECGLNITIFLKDTVLRSVTTLLVVAIIVYLVHFIFPSEGFIRLLIVIITNIVLFVGFAYYIGLTPEERNLFKGFTKNIRRYYDKKN